MMLELKLMPHDVLFLRDGKPFGSEDVANAGSVFPPTLATMAGALRATLLSALGIDPVDFIAGKTAGSESSGWIGSFSGRSFRQAATLRLRHVFLEKDGECWVAAPGDLGRPKGKAATVAGPLPLRPFSWVRAGALPMISNERSWPFLLVDGGGSGLENSTGLFVRLSDLKGYLLGKPEPLEAVELDRFAVPESHVRNNLDRGRKTTRERGGLFQNRVFRLHEGVGFRLWFDWAGPELDCAGHVALGGDQHLAAFHLGPASSIPHLPSFSDFSAAYRPGHDLLKIVLSSSAPVLGQIPVPLLDQMDIQGVACAGTTPVGGWDLAASFPKPLLQNLLPGTVFLVRPKSELTEQQYREWTSSSAWVDENRGEGFGAALLAVHSIQSQGE